MSVQQAAERASADAVIPKAPGPDGAVAQPYPSSITDITVKHGPVDVIGRFFLDGRHGDARSRRRLVVWDIRGAAGRQREEPRYLGHPHVDV